LYGFERTTNRAGTDSSARARVLELLLRSKCLGGSDRTAWNRRCGIVGEKPGAGPIERHYWHETTCDCLQPRVGAVHGLMVKHCSTAGACINRHLRLVLSWRKP